MASIKIDVLKGGSIYEGHGGHQRAMVGGKFSLGRVRRGSGYCVGAVVDGSGLYLNTGTQSAASSSSPSSSFPPPPPPTSSPFPSPSISTIPIRSENSTTSNANNNDQPSVDPPTISSISQDTITNPPTTNLTIPIQNKPVNPEDEQQQQQQQGKEEDGFDERGHAKIGKRDVHWTGSGNGKQGGKGIDSADDNGMGDMWILGEPFLRGVDVVFDVSFLFPSTSVPSLSIFTLESSCILCSPSGPLVRKYD